MKLLNDLIQNVTFPYKSQGSFGLYHMSHGHSRIGCFRFHSFNTNFHNLLIVEDSSRRALIRAFEQNETKQRFLRERLTALFSPLWMPLFLLVLRPELKGPWRSEG